MEHTAPLMSDDEVRSDRNVLAVSNRIVELAPSAEGGRASTKPKRKETVLNDVTNTGVMAALIGGFALSCLQSTDFRLDEHDHSTLDEIIYVLLVFAVHACTCSALTSAFLYRQARPHAVTAAARSHHLSDGAPASSIQRDAEAQSPRRSPIEVDTTIFDFSLAQQ